MKNAISSLLIGILLIGSVGSALWLKYRGDTRPIPILASDTQFGTIPPPLTPNIVGNCAAITATTTPAPVSTRRITPQNATQLEIVDTWGNGELRALEWSPDGSMIVVARPGQVLLYDAKTFSVRYILPHALVNTLVFSSDGTTLATQDEDNFVQVWNLADGTLLSKKAILGDLRMDMWGPAGEFVYVLPEEGLNKYSLRRLGDDSVIQMYDLPYTLNHHILYAATKDTFIEFLSAPDHEIRFWDVRNSEVTDKIFPPERDVTPQAQRNTTITLSADESLLGVAHYDQTIDIWRMSDKTLLHALEGAGIVNERVDQGAALQISPNKRFIAATSPFENIASLWDLETEKFLFSVPADYHDFFTFSPDSRFIAVGTPDQDVAIYALDGLHLITTLEGSPAISAFGIHPTTGVLAIASQKQVNFIRDGSRTPLCTLYIGVYVRQMVFSPDGRFIVVASLQYPYEHNLIVVDLSENRLVGTIPDSFDRPFAINPVNNTVTVATEQGKLIAWDLESLTSTQIATTTHVEALTYSLQGNRITVTVQDTTLTTDDTEITLLSADDFSAYIPGNGVAFAPAGHPFVVASGQDFLWWDEDLNKPALHIVPKSDEEDFIDLIRFSSDGTLVVTLSAPNPDLQHVNNAVRVYDANTGKVLAEWKFRFAEIAGVEISPMGDAIYTAHHDGTIRVWGISE